MRFVRPGAGDSMAVERMSWPGVELVSVVRKE